MPHLVDVCKVCGITQAEGLANQRTCEDGEKHQFYSEPRCNNCLTHMERTEEYETMMQSAWQLLDEIAPNEPITRQILQLLRDI